MSTPVRLAGFGVVLAVALGGGLAAGALVGPFDPGGADVPATEHHSPGDGPVTETIRAPELDGGDDGGVSPTTHDPEDSDEHAP